MCGVLPFGPQIAALLAIRATHHAPITAVETIEEIAIAILDTAPSRISLWCLSIGGMVANEVIARAETLGLVMEMALGPEVLVRQARVLQCRCGFSATLKSVRAARRCSYGLPVQIIWYPIVVGFLIVLRVPRTLFTKKAHPRQVNRLEAHRFLRNSLGGASILVIAQ